MKSIRVLVLILLAVAMAACGANSARTDPANGAWSEALSSSTGQPLGSFTVSITQNNTALTGSGMNFVNMGSLEQCFGTGTVMSGQMAQGMMNGGTMTMTLSWTAPNNGGTDTLAMQGNMAMGMGSGSGTYTLTGQAPGCVSQQGTYTMTHMM